MKEYVERVIKVLEHQSNLNMDLFNNGDFSEKMRCRLFTESVAYDHCIALLTDEKFLSDLEDIMRRYS